MNLRIGKYNYKIIKDLVIEIEMPSEFYTKLRQLLYPTINEKKILKYLDSYNLESCTIHMYYKTDNKNYYTILKFKDKIFIDYVSYPIHQNDETVTYSETFLGIFIPPLAIRPLITQKDKEAFEFLNFIEKSVYREEYKRFGMYIDYLYYYSPFYITYYYRDEYLIIIGDCYKLDEQQYEKIEEFCRKNNYLLDELLLLRYIIDT